MIDVDNETTLALVSKLPDIIRSMKSDSLIEFTQPTRIEPIVLIDDRLVGLSFMPDIMQTLVNVFSGYYLQAVALSVNVGRVDVLQLLDKVNPNRNLGDNAIRGLTNFNNLRTTFESADAYEYALPLPDQPIGIEHFGLERSFYDALREEGDATVREEEGPRTETGYTDKDMIRYAQEVNTLSVGKLLNVEININCSKNKASFPVLVRLIPTTTPPKGITHTLSIGQRPRSVKERFKAWRSGQLSFIRDLVFAQDLIDAHKESLKYDAANIYKQSLDRNRRNKLSAILSGNPSVATASNLIVFSDTTRKEVERSINGRLSHFRTRESVFKNTYSMIMVIVDPEWENVTLYHRSIETPSELTTSDFKNASKGKGPDVMEILKAYQVGSSPRL